MCACPRAPATTKTASTPSRASSRARRVVSSIRHPRGAATCTVVTNCPVASFRPHAERSPSGASARPGSSAGSARAETDTRAGCTLATWSRILRAWEGVVPQHPPTKRAPTAIRRRAYWPMYSGLAM